VYRYLSRRTSSARIMRPYIVLTEYVPTIWRAWKVGEDLTRITRKLGFLPHIDPEHGPQKWCPWFSTNLHAEVIKRTPIDGQSEGWHYDGDLKSGANPHCAIVTWASTTPTQWKNLNSEVIYQPQSFQLVIANNYTKRHRRPPNCLRFRYLFRQRVQLPTHMNLP